MRTIEAVKAISLIFMHGLLLAKLSLLKLYFTENIKMISKQCYDWQSLFLLKLCNLNGQRVYMQFKCMNLKSGPIYFWVYCQWNKTTRFLGQRKCLIDAAVVSGLFQGISGFRIGRDQLDVLGSMCCFLSGDYIQGSDSYVLEKLKQCVDLSAQQISALESVLLGGNTSYGYKLAHTRMSHWSPVRYMSSDWHQTFLSDPQTAGTEPRWRTWASCRCTSPPTSGANSHRCDHRNHSSDGNMGLCVCVCVCVCVCLCVYVRVPVITLSLSVCLSGQQAEVSKDLYSWREEAR